MISISDAAQLATTIGVLLALATLLKGLLEFTRQNALKRADYFFALIERLKAEPNARITALLDHRDAAVADVPYDQKVRFLGLFEEIALSVNSGILRKEVAHYMFAYYAMRCWESDAFWSGLDRNAYYWSLFRNFAENMQSYERDVLAPPAEALSKSRGLRF